MAFVTLEREGHIALITMNRPEALNALNRQVLEELSQDYVTGARARGVKESVILWRNVFPNALLPLVTMFGLSIGSLLGGTSVVEVIFSYPGLGNLAVSAITSSDYNLIQGYVLWLALIYMVINLLVDASYGAIDPRTRAKEEIR